MRLRISKIHETAKSRPPGYVEDVIASGVIAGEWLEISESALAELRGKYRPPMPPAGTVAVNAARAVIAEAKARFHGAPPVSDEDAAARLAICQGCDEFDDAAGRCSKCGCFSAYKVRLRSQHCPIGKW